MYDRVHFEGKWNQPDIQAVAAAIWKAEVRIGASPSPALGKTWICVREEVDESCVLYIASRFGFHSTLTALTSQSLADRIEEFGEVAVPYVDMS